PRRGVGGRSPHAESARGLRVAHERSAHSLAPLDADLRLVIEIGPVPLEATQLMPVSACPRAPGRSGTRLARIRTASDDSCAISYACPPRPNPVMSVAA